jgi:hypothetical protein
MALKRSHFEKWAAAEFPDETFVSYAVTSTWKAVGFMVPTGGAGNLHISGPDLGDGRRRDLVQRLGLDPNGGFPGSQTTFLLLTDRRMVLGARSALNRPKTVLHTAPVDGVTVYWFDADAGSGNRFRHFLTVFGDGRGRSDRAGLSALGRELQSSNADEFVEALGDRAIEATGV